MSYSLIVESIGSKKVKLVVKFAVTGRASECGVKHTKTTDVIAAHPAINACFKTVHCRRLD